MIGFDGTPRLAELVRRQFQVDDIVPPGITLEVEDQHPEWQWAKSVRWFAAKREFAASVGNVNGAQIYNPAIGANRVGVLVVVRYASVASTGLVVAAFGSQTVALTSVETSTVTFADRRFQVTPGAIDGAVAQVRYAQPAAVSSRAFGVKRKPANDTAEWNGWMVLPPGWGMEAWQATVNTDAAISFVWSERVMTALELADL